jgi:translation initiation factor 4A
MEKKLEITTDIDTNWFESVESFDDLKLNENLLRGIYGKYIISGYGYEKPSIIQSRGIMPLLRGRDTIA